MSFFSVALILCHAVQDVKSNKPTGFSIILENLENLESSNAAFFNH